MDFLQGISNIGLQTANTNAKTSLSNMELDFISKYGKTTDNYDNLDQLGNIRNKNIFIIIFVFAVILCIMSFIFYSKTIDQPILTQFLYYLGWFFVIVIITMLGYGGYFFFFLYLPQYTSWMKQLPIDAKTELAMIDTLSNLVNQTNTSNNRNVYDSNKGYSYH